MELKGLQIDSSKEIDLGSLNIPILIPKKGKDYFTNAEIQQIEKNITEAVNKSLVEAETERENAETVRKENEINRVEKEEQRIQSEQVRVGAENERTTNELARIANEEERKTNESKRIQLEQQVRSQEEIRTNAETLRSEAEESRIVNENIRKQNEESRIAEEQNRKTSEDVRKLNEADREEAEEIRKSQESQRIANENARIATEASREERITSLETDNATNKTEIQSLKEKNTQQDTKLSNLETKNVEQDNKITNLENKNIEQDTNIQNVSNAVNEINKKIENGEIGSDYDDTAVKERISNLESDNTANKEDILEIVAKNETQDTKIETLEGNVSNINRKNAEQDTSIEKNTANISENREDIELLEKQSNFVTMEGKNIQVTDAIKWNKNRLELSGNTLEVGTGEKSPDNPYEISGVSGDVTVTRCGKNLINIPDFQITGGTTAYKSKYFYARLKAGTYCFRRKFRTVSGTLPPSGGMVQFYKTNGNVWIKNLMATEGAIKLVFDEDTTITITLYLSGAQAGTEESTIEFYDIQMEKSDIVTSFEQYVGKDYVVPVQQEMLEGDYFDVDNKKEVHTRKRAVFENAEGFVRNSVGDNYTEFLTPLLEEIAQNAQLVSTHLENYKTGLISAMSGITPGSKVRVRMENSILGIETADTDKVKVQKLDTWIQAQKQAGTPFMIIYELAQPAELELTEAQSAILEELYNDFSCEDGVNNIFDNNTVGFKKKLTYMQNSEVLREKVEQNTTDIQVLKTNDTKQDTEIKALQDTDVVQNEKISKNSQEIADLDKLSLLASTSGEIIHLSNSADNPCKIEMFGNSKQENAPSLEAPVEVQAVEGDIDVTVCNKNLIDLTRDKLTTSACKYSNLLSNSVDLLSISTWSNILIQKQELRKNTDYSVSAKFIETIAEEVRLGLTVYVGDEANIATANILIDNKKNVSKNNETEIVLNFNTGGYKYIFFRVWSNCSGNTILEGNSLVKVSDIQLEEGEKTEIIANKQQNLEFTLAEGQELVGFKTTDKNLANYIDKDGNGWVCDYLASDGIHKRTRKIVVDGENLGNTASDLGTRYGVNFNINMADCEEARTGKFISNMFSEHDWWHDDIVSGFYQNAPKTGILFMILKTTLDKYEGTTYKEKAINFFATNNFVIYLIKNEEEVIPYSDAQRAQHEAIKNARTYKNITNIFSTNEVAPILKATYKKDLETEFKRLQTENETLRAELEGKVDKVTGMGLSQKSYTAAEQEKLSNIDAGAQKNAEGTVVDANYVHSDNNFTTEEKEKLGNLTNYDDTDLKNRIVAVETKNANQDTAIGNKVDKVEGMGLSQESFTIDEKNKLKDLANYNDEALKTRVSTLETDNSKNKTDITGMQEAMQDFATKDELGRGIKWTREDLLTGFIEGIDINITDAKEYNRNILELSGNTIETITGEKSPLNPSKIKNAGGECSFTFNDETFDFVSGDAFPNMCSVGSRGDYFFVDTDGICKIDRGTNFFEIYGLAAIRAEDAVVEIDDTWIKLVVRLEDDVVGSCLTNCKTLTQENFICNWLDDFEETQVTEHTHKHGYIFIQDYERNLLGIVIKKEVLNNMTGNNYYDKVEEFLSNNPFKILLTTKEWKTNWIYSDYVENFLYGLDYLALRRGSNTITDTSGFYKTLYYMKNEIESNSIKSIQIVDTLPETEEEGILYLVTGEQTPTEPDPPVEPETPSNLWNGTTYITNGNTETQLTSPSTVAGVEITFNKTNFNFNGQCTSSSNLFCEPVAIPFEAGKSYQIYLDFKSGTASVGTSGRTEIGEIAIFSDKNESQVIVKQDVLETDITAKFQFTPAMLDNYYVRFRMKDGIIYSNFNFDIIIEEVV